MPLYKNALIVTGGSISDEYLKELTSEHEFHIIAAVDNGLKALDRAGIIPSHVIGDFDSASSSLVEKYDSMSDVKVLRLPVNKDLTDTQAAVELVISSGCTKAYVLGALGGARPDHSIANIHLLVHFLNAGIEAFIVNKTSCIFLLNKNIAIHKSEQSKKYLSLLPLTWQVSNITLKGMKYPLDNAMITMGDSIGISNEIIEDTAEIQFNEGVLIVILSDDG